MRTVYCENIFLVFCNGSIRKQVSLWVINQLYLEMISYIFWTNSNRYRFGRIPAMEQRSPFDSIYAVAVFIDHLGDLLSIPQEFL